MPVGEVIKSGSDLEQEAGVMNPYQLLIPQLLAGLVIVVIARRAVYQTRQENYAYKEELKKQQEELKQYLSQVEAAAANPGVPAREFITERKSKRPSKAN